jgi:hypothetical protein
MTRVMIQRTGVAVVIAQRHCDARRADSRMVAIAEAVAVARGADP